MATEKQIPKLLGLLVEHQELFSMLTAKEMQQLIQNPKDAINLFVEAVKNRADTIIRVYRNIPPAYPDTHKDVVHPELEMAGPAQYDMSELQLWLHPKQKEGVCGNEIYEYLLDNSLIKYCLGFADLQAIQAKGLAYYRKYFSGKSVYGWKSVVRSGFLNVPFLSEVGNKLDIWWAIVPHHFESDEPALLLP